MEQGGFFCCISTKRNQLLTEIALLEQMEETDSITLVQHTQKAHESRTSLVGSKGRAILETKM